MNNSSTTMEMTDTGGGSNRTNGVRFQDVKIWRGADVLSATIDFHSLGNDDGDADFTVAGHLVFNSPTFPTGSGTNDPFDRLDELTTATVDWSDAEEWGQNDRHFTPDLSAIVEEIVDQPGWNAGNAMTFIFTGTDGSFRRAATYNNNSTRAAILRVELADPGS